MSHNASAKKFEIPFIDGNSIWSFPYNSANYLMQNYCFIDLVTYHLRENNFIVIQLVLHILPSFFETKLIL